MDVHPTVGHQGLQTGGGRGDWKTPVMMTMLYVNSGEKTSGRDRTETAMQAGMSKAQLLHI